MSLSFSTPLGHQWNEGIIFFFINKALHWLLLPVKAAAIYWGEPIWLFAHYSQIGVEGARETKKEKSLNIFKSPNNKILRLGNFCNYVIKEMR